MAADYWRSSQANHWLLDATDLKLSRLEDERYAGSSGRVSAVTICLSNAIVQLARRLSLRQRVVATATVLFHRFYAVPPNAYCNTDPCLVATACVYVAAKVEETHLHVRTVAQEATKMWQDYGHLHFPTSSVDLAEMEFFLVRDLDYHLILHHPYRTLMSIVGRVGKASIEKAEASHAKGAKSDASSGSSASQRVTGLGLHAETLGVGSSRMGLPNYDTAGLPQQVAPKGEADARSSGQEDQDRAEQELARWAMTAGDHGLPTARAEEIDEDIVQMAWFLLNDTYRHASIHLLFPPYIIAVSALYLALVLHEKSREKLEQSARRMQQRRKRHHEATDMDGTRPQEGLKKPKDESRDDSRNVNGQRESPVLKDGPTAISNDKPTVSNATAAAAAGSGGAGTRLPHGLPPRPAHLPPRPGSAVTTTASSHRSPNPGQSQASAASATSRSAVASTASPSSPHVSASHDSSGTGASPLQSSLQGDQTLAEGEPMPPPDALTFLASLNLSLTSDLASCIQHLLDGYATWAAWASEIEGPAGFKKVVGWLHEWRMAREEELRVLELEEREAAAKTETNGTGSN